MWFLVFGFWFGALWFCFCFGAWFLDLVFFGLGVWVEKFSSWSLRFRSLGHLELKSRFSLLLAVNSVWR